MGCTKSNLVKLTNVANVVFNIVFFGRKENVNKQHVKYFGVIMVSNNNGETKSDYESLYKEFYKNLTPEELESLKTAERVSAEDITRKRKRISLSSGCCGDPFREIDFEDLGEDYPPDEVTFMKRSDIDLSYLGQNGKCLVVDGSYAVVPV